MSSRTVSRRTVLATSAALALAVTGSVPANAETIGTGYSVCGSTSEQIIMSSDMTGYGRHTVVKMNGAERDWYHPYGTNYRWAIWTGYDEVAGLEFYASVDISRYNYYCAG